MLGSEVSEHFFSFALGGDDPLYATLLALRALESLGISFAKAMDTAPPCPITPDIRLSCPSGMAQLFLMELASALPEHPISRLDGVPIQFDDGWVLARLSVIEPLLALRYEAQTHEALRTIEGRIRQASLMLNALLDDAGAQSGRTPSDSILGVSVPRLSGDALQLAHPLLYREPLCKDARGASH